MLVFFNYLNHLESVKDIAVICNIKFQVSEVQTIKFVSLRELNEMREQNLLVERDEYYEALAEYLFRI